jgi:septal ring factor EnvC (AmiA/AmiB activator)
MQGEIAALEKRLKNETEGRRTLEEQLRRQEQEESHTQNSRRKIQEELQALQALSDSLSAENQGKRVSE